MKPKFYQFNCIEGNGPDYRQARAILKYRPDIIIFEMSEKNGSPELLFNKYPCNKKPKAEIKKIQSQLRKDAEKFKYALSDVKVWDNISALWNKNHNISLYNVDAPDELRKEWFEVWHNTYPCAIKNWLWWVPIYLRERIMAKNIRHVLNSYEVKQNPKILVFLQSFHWKHVKFLLSNPPKDKIWDYYFGKFPEISKATIGSKIKKLNKIYYKYWVRYGEYE